MDWFSDERGAEATQICIGAEVSCYLGLLYFLTEHQGILCDFFGLGLGQLSEKDTLVEYLFLVLEGICHSVASV